ncbi:MULTISPECIES: hypothetical protein [unclassified Streptomyces]|uniref:hypothetical protein n=1 Tax=unclassified Streptomyces TaxID=2593676 RepID=UPI003332A400
MTDTLPVRGRPALLTADIIKSVAASVSEGHSQREAAAAAGVNVSSLNRWLLAGRRLKASGADPAALPSYQWLCLRLARSVDEAAARREEESGPFRQGGRRSALTAESVDAIVAVVATGRGMGEAATAVGVSKRTLQLWLTRGAQTEKPETETDRLCVSLHQKVTAARSGQPQSKGGRPAVLTSELVDTVVAAMNGGSAQTAAAAAGVTARTVQRWLSRGARLVYPATEYERLCVSLHQRVNAPEAADVIPAGGVLELPAAPGVDKMALDLALLERKWQEAGPNRPLVVPPDNSVTISPYSIAARKIGPGSVESWTFRPGNVLLNGGSEPEYTGIEAKGPDSDPEAVWQDTVDTLRFLSRPRAEWQLSIEAGGRFRQWLRCLLRRAADAL